MKRITVIIFFLFFIGHSNGQAFKDFKSIDIDTIITGKMSVRAIIADGNKIWYGADEGRFGFFDISDKTTYEKRIVFDSLKPEFRSIAKTSKSIFIINAGSPALLYKIDKVTLKSKLVYRETESKAFYDSMQFWNDEEGIAIGDPISDCLSILITRNGGETWSKIDCANLPKTFAGEAAFAASNSNIILKGEKTWIISGGIKSRIFYSPDKGMNWIVNDTPIVQGREMTGAFTGDFYDGQIGFIAGGDYEKPNQNFGNKAISEDGGKTWELIADNKGFGYASCIQFVPNSNGKQLVCVGATGLFYSGDRGKSWSLLSEDKTLYTIRFITENTAIAAGKNKIVRIKFR